MKKLISVLAAIGALAFASSASAGEVSALTSPGIIKVNADVQIFSAGTLRVLVRVDTNTRFDQTIAVTENTTSHSEFVPGALSYDVSSAVGILEFSLRLHPGAPVGSVVTVDVEVVDDAGATIRFLDMGSPDRLTTPL